MSTATDAGQGGAVPEPAAAWVLDDPGEGTVGMGEGIMVIDNAANPGEKLIAEVFRADLAPLVAAAPDLLAACVEFVRKVEAGEARSTRSYQQMKAAIARATGEAA